MDQSQKVVLIVGATTHIGEATAREYAKLGHKMLLVGHDRVSLDRVKVSVEHYYKPKNKTNCRVFCLNQEKILLNYESIEAKMSFLGRAAKQYFSKLDIVINIIEFTREYERYIDYRKQLNLAFDFIFYDSIDLIRDTSSNMCNDGIFITAFSILDRLKRPSMTSNAAQAAWTAFFNDYTTKEQDQWKTMTIAPQFVDGDRVDLENEVRDIASMIVDSTLNNPDGRLNGQVINYIGREKTVRP